MPLRDNPVRDNPAVEKKKRGRPKKSVYKFNQAQDSDTSNEIIKSKFKFVENSQGSYDVSNNPSLFLYPALQANRRF